MRETPEYEREARARWATLSGAEKDTLVCLCRRGPTWDGDVPSKAGRDGLIAKGLAAQIVLKGPEYGYQAATPLGANTYKWGFVEPRKDLVRLLISPFERLVKP